jgi:hypothetical protein
MKKIEFSVFLESLNKCYSKGCYSKLPKLSDFSDEVFNKDGILDLSSLLKFSDAQSNNYIKSVSKRFVAVMGIIHSRETKKDLDIKNTWNLISDSISIIPNEDTISSIGSQGFLSIPLYKNDNVLDEFDFIRLHIWDISLLEFIDIDTCENFSIHTHKFSTNSWIVFGKVINDRYKISISDLPTEQSLFTIGYNKSLNEVNQHSSCANNTGINVHLKQVSQELHLQGNRYYIEAGDYHRSGTLEESGLSATFFSFTAKDGIVNESYVVGPSNIETSLINRKLIIDPSILLKKLDYEIN